MNRQVDRQLQNLRNPSYINMGNLLKGILILFVIYSHSLSQLNALRGMTWADFPISVYLTTFEMPMFIMVSGFFAFGSFQRNGAGKTLKNRLISLGLPVLVLLTLPVFAKEAYHLIKGEFHIIEFGTAIVGSFLSKKLWYLPCCLLCYIFVGSIQGLEDHLSIKHKNRFDLLYIAIVFGLMLYEWPVYLGYMFPFFLIGYLIAKYKLYVMKGSRWVVYAAAVLYIPALLFFKSAYSFYTAGSTFHWEQIGYELGIYTYRFFLNIAACAFVYVIATWIYKLLGNIVFVKCLCQFGVQSGALYIGHIFLYPYLKQAVAMLPLDFHAVLDSPLCFIVYAPIFMAILILVSLLIEFVLRYVPLVHKAVFGK